MRIKYFATQFFTILLISVIDCSAFRYINPDACKYTPTTVSGSKAPIGPICKGQLIFEDKFIDFDRDTWKHEVTLGGGGVSIKKNSQHSIHDLRFTKWSGHIKSFE